MDRSTVNRPQPGQFEQAGFPTRCRFLTKALPATLGALLMGNVALAQATKEPPPQEPIRGEAPARDRDNILLFIGDDMGVDVVGAYGLGNDLPPTPTLDSLAANGILFTNCWGNPLCSPTRANIQTGRYSFRNEVGTVLTGGKSLPLDEITLAEMLDRGTNGGYDCAYFGKWHLSNPDQGGADGPNLQGYPQFSGTLYNIACPDPACPPPWTNDYYNWPKTENGVESTSSIYATTETTDEAVSWLETAQEPWFLTVAYNAAHSPFDEPPSDLHTYDFSQGSTANQRYRAIIEAMDTEMGRLLLSIPTEVMDRTSIVFVCDNGTAGGRSVAPFDPDRAKSTLFDGGIRVPLIVSGRAAKQPGTVCDALVNACDVFPTIAHMAKINVRSVYPGVQFDGLSLKPYLFGPNRPSIRTHIYAEQFIPNGTNPQADYRAVRNSRFKLIRVVTGNTDPYGAPELLFDLITDPYENTNLLDSLPLDLPAQSAYDELDSFLANLIPGR